MYKVSSSTFSVNHIGQTFDHVDVGNILTFEDGFAFQIQKKFADDDSDSVIIIDGKQQMVLTKE